MAHCEKSLSGARDVVELLPNCPQTLNEIRLGKGILTIDAIDFLTRDHCANYVSS